MRVTHAQKRTPSQRSACGHDAGCERRQDDGWVFLPISGAARRPYATGADVSLRILKRPQLPLGRVAQAASAA
jgi:hypothetical protein